MSLVVVSFDPGISTGFAVHLVDEKELVKNGQVRIANRMRWASGQYKTYGTSANVDTALDIGRTVYEDMVDEGDLFIWVIEGFRLFKMSSNPELLEPVRWIAVFRDRLRETGAVIEEQMPGEKEVISDARLKLWQLWKELDGGDHHRSAQKHGLLFLRKFATDKNVRARAEVGRVK